MASATENCWACEQEPATMRNGMCGDCWAESGGTAAHPALAAPRR